MSSRLDLHEVLCEILGSRNVYFQPPASVKMKYPAIVYSRKYVRNRFANNSVYMQLPCYEVVVIDKSPESAYTEKISLLPLCEFDRHYAADNLNHDVFTLYY